jgi:integrase
MKKRANGEGSVYQRKDGLWAAAVSLGCGKRKVVYCQSQAEAVYALHQAQHARLFGTLTSTRNETVEDFLLKWLQYEVQPRVRERTYQTYRQVVTHDLLPALGHLTLQRLTSWNIQALYPQKRRQQVSPSTILKIHRILHRALNDAVKLGHVVRNVGQFVVLPPIQKQERVTRVLTVEQARHLLAVAKDDHLEALYVLALTTGLRQRELLALTWSDLDLTYGKLQVQRTLLGVSEGKAKVAAPKTPASRRCVRLTDLAIEALTRHHQQQRLIHQQRGRCKRLPEWVFCDHKGVPLQASHLVRHSFQPLLVKAGLPRMRFHDLRHSTATLLLTLGVHPKIVQELLGHSQIFVTLDIYSHILPTLQAEAMQHLNTVLGECPQEAEPEKSAALKTQSAQPEAERQDQDSMPSGD